MVLPRAIFQQWLHAVLDRLWMSLGEVQGPLKVPLEVLQAVVANKEQCVPVERVAE